MRLASMLLAILVSTAAIQAQPPAGDGPGVRARGPAASRPSGLMRGLRGPGNRPLDGPGLGPGAGERLAGPGQGEAALRPQEIEEFMAFLRQHFPELHDRLARARREDPRMFRQLIRQAAPPIVQLMRIAREDPQLAKMIMEVQRVEMRIHALTRRYHETVSEAQRSAFRDQLRALIEQRYDKRVERLRAEIEALRHRLDAEQRRLAQQDANRARIIEDELKKVLDNPPPPPPPSSPGHHAMNPSGPPASREAE